MFHEIKKQSVKTEHQKLILNYVISRKALHTIDKMKPLISPRAVRFFGKIIWLVSICSQGRLFVTVSLNLEKPSANFQKFELCRRGTLELISAAHTRSKLFFSLFSFFKIISLLSPSLFSLIDYTGFNERVLNV